MLNDLLQISLNVNTIHFYISVIMMIIAILAFGQKISAARKTDMEKKVDIEEYKQHKIVIDSRLSRKVDKELFNTIMKSVTEDISITKKSSDAAIKLLSEDLKENCRKSESMSELLVEIRNDVKWLKKEGGKA